MRALSCGRKLATLKSCRGIIGFLQNRTIRQVLQEIYHFYRIWRSSGKVKFIVFIVVVLASCGSGERDSGAGATECPRVDAADLATITLERAEMLIGFKESDAESCATSLGWAFRVGERDGESFALTADYSQQRVTVSVFNDLVTAVVVG